MHNDYPLAPETGETSHILSNYCSNIPNKYGRTICSVNKLVPILGNKSKYVLHYRSLQLYLLIGMKLVSVYRVLKFWDSDWLIKEIEFNTDKKNVAHSFEKKTF